MKHQVETSKHAEICELNRIMVQKQENIDKWYVKMARAASRESVQWMEKKIARMEVEVETLYDTIQNISEVK